MHDDHGSVAHHHGGGFPWRDGLVKKGSTMNTKARLGLQIGSTLPNCGIVLDSYVWEFHFAGDYEINRQFGYVLALLPDARHDKYATWSFVEDERGLITTAGHYFASVGQAVTDFESRKGSHVWAEDPA
jgi:hypothetical protein